MARSSDKKFNWDVCGHEKVASFLQAAISNDKISHAYLFVGPARVGKQTLARQFIESFFCLSADRAVPCGDCSNCRPLRQETHPDFYLVNRFFDDKTGKWKKDIIIDQIRELKLKLQQTTLLSGYKAALIPEAQLINEKAYNSLLKLLEEPTAKTVIILLTDDLGRIPRTIVSRCQQINFLPVAGSKIEKYLLRAGAEPAKAKKMARLAHGLPGRAISFFQDEQLLKNWQANQQSFLKIFSDQPIDLDCVAEIIDWEKDEVLNIEKINRLLDDWQVILRDLLLFLQGSQYHAASIEIMPAWEKMKSRFSFSRIRRAVAQLDRSRELLRQNINTKVILENLIINL